MDESRFQRKPEYDRAIEAAVVELGRWRPGEVVPHRILSDAMGYTYGNDLYHYLTMKARIRFQGATGLTCEPVNGEGYLIQTPGRTLREEQIRRYKRSRRQLVKMRNSVIALRADDLTPNQRRIRDASISDADHYIESLRRRRAMEEKASAPAASEWSRAGA